MYLKLTNLQKRTADLFLMSLTPPKSYRMVVRTAAGDVEPEKQTVLVRNPNWTGTMTPAQISESLVKDDPELDTNVIGRPVQLRSTVFLDVNRQPATDFKVLEEKILPNGEIKETRPYKPTEPNVELPVQVSAKGGQSTAEMVQKFVTHKIYQIIHTDSLSYDFLFNLCQEIHDKGFVRLAGGLKGNEPLILRREGLPSFAYLQGKVDGKKYRCTLHLTHQELKAPAGDTRQAGAP
jgi:hypothetical protein